MGKINQFPLGSIPLSTRCAPRGSPARQSRSGRDGPAKIYVCLQLGISFNAELSMLALPRATPPRPQRLSGPSERCPSISFDKLVPFPPPNPSSTPTLCHSCVSAKLFFKTWDKVLFRQIRHCVCAYFHDNGTLACSRFYPGRLLSAQTAQTLSF